MRDGGRAAREEARSRPVAQIETFVTTQARVLTPWLLTADGPPKSPHAKLQALRTTLAREARTEAEAVSLSDTLLAHVERWNADHPGDEVAAPAPVVMLHTRRPAWTDSSLRDLALAREFRNGFEAACTALSQTDVPDAAHVAGLVLASALLDSACQNERDLLLVAGWLADPGGAVYSAPDLPPWIDLKHRAPSARKKRPGLLRKVSGMDSQGDYALRRLFLAPRTLELVVLYDRLGSAGSLWSKTTRTRHGLQRLIARCCSNPTGINLRRVLRGSSLALQAQRNGPDHTIALLAERRLESFAAIPESWPHCARAAVSRDPAPLRQTDTLLAPPTPPVNTAQRPVPEDRAFFQLQAALSDKRKARADLTTAATKLTKGALVARLHKLPWTADTPSCLRLLRDWYLKLLEIDGDAVSSVRRYHSTLAAALCDMAGTVALDRSDSDQLEELYTLVLETDTRSPREQVHLRQRLHALHRFAMADLAWDFPEIEPGFLQGQGEAVRIHATLLDRDAINQARHILRGHTTLPPDVVRAADAVLLVMSRAGLRIGEATKALYAHYEDVRSSGLDPADATLFVKPSIFGNNKTPGAYRQIRLLSLMTEAEAHDFQDYLSHRRGFSPKGPLFGVAQKDGSVAPFDAQALGAVLSECLRQATGLSDAASHALRRAAANALFLTLHEARTPNSSLRSFLTGFTGWSPEKRARIAELVAPASQPRDCWQALARHFGHGGPGTTFEAYINVADLAVFETCATGRDDQARSARALDGLGLRHVHLRPDASGPQQTGPGDISGDISSPAHALYRALLKVDDGDPADRAARAEYLPLHFFEDRIPIAQAWSGLTTNRKKNPKLRLQPPDRAGKIAPAPLDYAAKLEEALSIADKLIDLAKRQPGAVEAWICFTLQDATTGNAGTRLRTPAGLKDWAALAIKLRPAPRWQVERVDPVDVTRENQRQWSTARPPETKVKLSKSATAKSIVARVRLLRPETKGTAKGNPKGSWAGCIRFAAHLAAIQLGYEVADP